MSERLAELAARKELLLARSRMHRLQLQHQARALRRALVRPATVLSVAASAPVRPLLFSALLFVAGRSRAARLVRAALAVLAVGKVLGVVAGLLPHGHAGSRGSPAAPKIQASRLRPPPSPGDPAHEEWLIDAGADGSFPASDPSAVAQPRPHPR